MVANADSLADVSQRTWREICNLLFYLKVKTTIKVSYLVIALIIYFLTSVFTSLIL